jgi:hypothetical protein
VRTIDALRLSGLRDWYAVIRSLRRAAAGKDVVHAHGLRVGAAAARAVRHAPVVVTLHNAPLATGIARRAQLAAERAVIRGARVVLAASDDLRARAERAGAKEALLAPVAAPPRVPAAVSDEPLPVTERRVALTIARLAPQKRHRRARRCRCRLAARSGRARGLDRR